MSTRLHVAGSVFALHADEGGADEVSATIERPVEYHGAEASGGLIGLRTADGGRVFVRVHPAMDYAISEDR